MKENIKQIIEELYGLDPELKNYEDRLIKIVEKFIESRPDTKFDAEFARTLKAKILSEPMPEKAAFSFFNTFNMNRNYLILSGAALAVVVFAVALQIKPKAVTSPGQISFGRASVTKLSANAFGPLSSATGNVGATAESAPQALSSVGPAIGRGGGGMGVAMPSVGTGSNSSVAVSDAPVADAKMMIYRPYVIKYNYKGEALELKDKTLDVFRRTKPQLNTGGAVSSLNSYSFGGVNLNTFPNSSVGSFELVQKDGYIVNVNVREGMISIAEVYDPAKACPNGVCPVVQPLRPSEMPSDETIISISNKFLKDHGVNLANYGEPKVENDWLRAAETMPADYVPYIPEVISVAYPTVINGMAVYDLGGGINGLRVNVDVRKKSVNGAWSIVNQNYESSGYEAETDAAKVIKVAENGGIYGGGYMDPGAEVVEVELGTPKRVFVNMWKPDGTGEIIVPALNFPVLNAPKAQQYYVQSSVIIPLVKEMLQVPEPGPIRIMEAQPGVATPPQATDASTVSSPEPAIGL